MMRELGVVCRACFCTFHTSEMNTHSYMPFLFSINYLCHLYNVLYSPGSWYQIKYKYNLCHARTHPMIQFS